MVGKYGVFKTSKDICSIFYVIDKKRHDRYDEDVFLVSVYHDRACFFGTDTYTENSNVYNNSIFVDSLKDAKKLAFVYNNSIFVDSLKDAKKLAFLMGII